MKKIVIQLTIGYNGVVGCNIIKNQSNIGHLINHIQWNYGNVCDERDILLLDHTKIHNTS